MKKVLKFVIPIVLVLALLGAAVWFFFFYRPDLTNGLLLRRAEIMAERGRYSRSVRYYSWASSLEPDRDDIAIGLAETYADSGNYTKAEYTLVKAISRRPDLTELYVALCKTYVAQDKLLDAVQMLDRTTDPDVKAALDAKRPAAPMISPESGYYNDYIDVTVTADVSTVYATSNGEYPASASDLYTEPLTLSSGESTVLAVCVDESGLVSPVSRNGYTVGGVVEPVTLQDSAFDSAIRTQLGLGSNDELMSDLLWSITNLEIPAEVRDLSDLSYFTGLQSLTVHDVSGLDFSVLTQIPSLRELDLSGCPISASSLTAIGSLTQLEKLVLNGCALVDISSFSQLTKLTELSLSDNSIKDISVISLMPSLQIVDLSNNPLDTITGLSACDNLTQVNISHCSITALGSLKNKAQLESLYASTNHIKSLDDLAGCSALATLEVDNNLISSIDVLPQLPALTRFEGSHNEITVIPDFDEKQCRLVFFGADYNQIESVAGLADIGSLNYVNVDYNKVSDLTPLAKNRNLIKVNAWDNPVETKSVEALNEYSIIVNVNPNYKP